MFVTLNLNFIDTDECIENNGGCDQKCVNQLGSYNCDCDMGYEMQQDNKTCTGQQIYYGFSGFKFQ